MTPYNAPTDDLEIPGNFSPDRPPILNETICGCNCGCAGCMCDDSGGNNSTPSDWFDGGDGHGIHFEDLVARLNELNLAHNDHEGLGRTPSGFFHPTPYQIYSVDADTDLGTDADAIASTSQFLHDHYLNHAERRFLTDLSLFHTYPRNLDDLFEAPSFRPHSPGGDSLLANPSEGEHSLMSSMTSSIQLSKRSVSPAYFTLGAGGCFETSPNHFLELTESLQYKHHCGHGVVCGSLPFATGIVVEGPDLGYGRDYDELE